MLKSLKQKLNNALHDNSGASLLELIIAVTILAIITAPLLNTFVISAKLNAKARTMGLETNVATQLYEKVKAADGNFLMEADSSGSDIVAAKLKDYFGADNSRLKDTTSDGVVKTRELSLEDISSGNRKYNARVTIDAEPTGDEQLISGSPYTNDYISTDNASKRTKQMSFDHVWMQPDGGPDDPDEKVMEKVPDGLTTTANDDGERILENTRRITVDLKKVKDEAASDGQTNGVVDRVSVNLTYEYKIRWLEVERDSNGQVKRDADGKKILPVEKRIYNTKKYSYPLFPSQDVAVYTTDPASQNMEAIPESPFPYTEMVNGRLVTHDFDVMIFFRPYYQSTEPDYKDQITVNNLDNLKGNIFLVKENPSDTDKYSGLVRLVENHPENKDDFNLSLHTNIGLSSEAGAKPGNKKRLSGGVFSLVKVYDGENYYNRIESLTNEDKDYETTSLIKQESLDHIYRIKVELYKSGSSDIAMTLSGIKVG